MLFLTLNFVFFQLLWFANVLGAGAMGHAWMGLAGLIPLALLAAFSDNTRGDYGLALLALAGGMALDTLWISLNILQFDGSSIAPFWIGSLWFGLGLTINHSMRWFRDQVWLGPIIVGVFGPVTYFTGQKLGAVEIVSPMLLPLITGAWIGFFVLLVRCSRVWQPAAVSAAQPAQS